MHLSKEGGSSETMTAPLHMWFYNLFRGFCVRKTIN